MREIYFKDTEAPDAFIQRRLFLLVTYEVGISVHSLCVRSLFVDAQGQGFWLRIDMPANHSPRTLWRWAPFPHPE